MSFCVLPDPLSGLASACSPTGFDVRVVERLFGDKALALTGRLSATRHSARVAQARYTPKLHAALLPSALHQSFNCAHSTGLASACSPTGFVLRVVERLFDDKALALTGRLSATRHSARVAQARYTPKLRAALLPSALHPKLQLSAQYRVGERLLADRV